MYFSLPPPHVYNCVWVWAHTCYNTHVEGWREVLFYRVHCEHKFQGKLGNNCPYLLSHVAGKNHVLKTAFALPLQQSFLSISCIYNEYYPATAGWNLSSLFVLVHPAHQHLLSLKPPEAPFGSIIVITGPVNPLPIWALKLGWLSDVSCISSLSKTTKDLPLHLRLSPYSSLAYKATHAMLPSAFPLSPTSHCSSYCSNADLSEAWTHTKSPPSRLHVHLSLYLLRYHLLSHPTNVYLLFCVCQVSLY